jgi:hypothetical protein
LHRQRSIQAIFGFDSRNSFGWQVVAAERRRIERTARDGVHDGKRDQSHGQQRWKDRNNPP